MAFALLPAVDVVGGRLGLYTASGPATLDAFGGDPIVAAEAFRAAGARWLHVVDLDRAFETGASNEAILRTLAAASDVEVQASGGVRTWADVAHLLEAGAARVVVSSAALADENAVTEIVERARPGEVAFGVEVRDGRIRARGAHAVDLGLMETVGWLRTSGATLFVATAVAAVGTEAGPDSETVRRVTRSGVPTIAAGGIRSIEDLAALREAGAVGAIVGRAALEGILDLDAALAWARV